MVEVRDCIRDAWIAILSQRGEDARIVLQSYVANLISAEKPYLWVTPAGLAHVIKQVFEDPDITDFAFMLQYHFFLRWATSAQKFTDLVDVLSWSCSPTAGVKDNTKDISAVPGVHQQRLATREDVVELLTVNTWMVCLLLLRAHIGIVDAATLRADLPRPARGQSAEVTV